MSQRIQIFLSYKREDYNIAQTLRRQIRNVTDRCDFFVDVDTIEAFDNWEERIETHLKSCDYFILIYTGQDKNYEYCMAEAGVFAASHRETNAPGNATAEPLSRLCCLHDTKEFPAFFSKYQNYHIVGYSETPAAGASLITEEQFYEDCQLARFLKKFFMLKPQDASGEPLRQDYIGSDFRDTRIAMVKAITASFLENQMGRVEFDQPLQDRIVLKIPNNHPLKISRDFDPLVIDASERTLDIFHIFRGNQPVTWGRLRHAYHQRGTYHVPWMADIERSVAKIIDGDTSEMRMDITFRALNNDQVFRPVPARYVKYFNGTIDMIITIIPARPRKLPMVGVNASLLLVGLFFAARFRHEFLDQELPILAIDSIEAELDAECENLKRSIEVIENDAAEFGLTDPQVLVNAVGPNHTGTIKRFFNEWIDSRQAIFNTIESRLHEDRQSPNDDEVKATICRAFEKLKPLNKDFVELMCKLLPEEAMNE